MPFESVNLQIQSGGDVAVSTWRQDVTFGAVITCSLSDTIGVTSFHWWLTGRPEDSGSGGGGPEPIDLGSAATATFTIDQRGTYIVWCKVNEGQPNATTIRGGCAYLETITDPSGRPLRLLGPQETDEDVADSLVRQGWLKMLNRWLRKIVAGGGGGGGEFPGYYDLPPEPVGISYPGTSTLVSRGDHEHALVPAESYSGSLFVARKRDPLRREPCRCILQAGSYIGFLGAPAVFEDVSSTYGPHTWRKFAEGQLWGRDSEGGNTIALEDGDLVFAYLAGDEPEKPYFGSYRVLDCGLHIIDDIPVATRAVIQRAPDADQNAEVTQGCFWQIQTGLYAGKWFVLQNDGDIVLGTTPLDFLIEDETPQEDEVGLYKADQLEGAYTDSINIVALATSGTPAEFEHVFDTVEGTLGISEVASGPYRVYLPCSCDNPGDGEATIEATLEIAHADLSTTVIFTVETTRINSSDSEIKELFVSLGSSTPFNAASDKLRLRCRAKSTVTPGYQVVRWHYNDQARTCRIVTPMSFSVSGTTDHYALTNRFPNVGLSEAPAHNLDGLGPGRLHTPFGSETTTDGNGCLTMPSDSNSCVVAGVGNFAGIATAGWMPGDHIWLTISAARTIVQGATGLPSGFAPFMLAWPDGMPAPYDIVLPHANARMIFQLGPGSVVWNLLGVVT